VHYASKLVICSLLGSAFALSFTVYADGAQSGMQSHDVQTIAANRASLVGQRVVVEGFLSYEQGYYFLAQGMHRPSGDLGPSGEQNWCNFSGSPLLIWFSESNIEQGQTELPLLPLGSGQRVVISGILGSEIPQQPFPEEDLGSYSVRDLANQSIGPLRAVRVVKVLNERCEGGKSIR
jgi:hypothetical protein